MISTFNWQKKSIQKMRSDVQFSFFKYKSTRSTIHMKKKKNNPSRLVQIYFYKKEEREIERKEIFKSEQMASNQNDQNLWNAEFSFFNTMYVHLKLIDFL